jgi:hypothetical protein
MEAKPLVAEADHQAYEHRSTRRAAVGSDPSMGPKWLIVVQWRCAGSYPVGSPTNLCANPMSLVTGPTIPTDQP